MKHTAQSQTEVETL